MNCKQVPLVKQLVFGLIEDYLGKTALEICKPLNAAGGKTLRQLSVETTFPRGKCAKVLYVLIRHGFVDVDAQVSVHAKSSREAVNYSLNYQKLLTVARHPMYLTYVRNLFGKFSMRIFCCLLIHGSLRFEDVLVLVQKNTRSQKFVRAAFKRLFEQRLIEPLSIDLNAEHLSEHCYTRSDILSFLSEEASKSCGTTHTAFWRVCTPDINLALQKCECLTSIRRCLVGNEDKIISLLKNKDIQPGTRDACAVRVVEIVNTLTSEHGMSVQEIHEALTSLLERSHLLEQSLADSRSVIIGLKRAISVAQVCFIHTIVKQRFGDTACRLFRLLCSSPQLEQKQISELAMIPLKDCREILGKLLKQEYVRMQEVARTVDHAPSRTIYLWKVQVPSVIAKISLEVQCTILSLETRLRFEKARIVKGQKRYSGVTDRQECFRSSTLLHEQKQAAEARIRKLEAALLRLEKVVLVFSL